MDQRIDNVWWILRVTFGLCAFLAGLDKFFGLLVDWQQYLSPLAKSVLPIAPDVLIQIVGAIEMMVGLAILSGIATRLGAYVVTGWLMLIALELVTNGKYFDIAVRDVVMALGAFSLAKLSEVRAEAPVRKPALSPI
ncbi:MAG TPA: DoxX family protein [Thermoanaerobaculia bacterium]|jgi:uncharacterized membrane protein YphA (DoxX/SURF4 family)